MNYKKYFFLLIILIGTLLSNADEINIDKNSIIGGDNDPGSQFKIIIWDNTEDLNLKYINKLSYEEIKNKYKSVITINEKNIINYYWDEQVIKIITDRKSYKKMLNIENTSSSNEFFSVILNNKILYNGLIWKGPIKTSNIIMFLPPYPAIYGKNISILNIRPSCAKGKMFKDFNYFQKKKLLIPELYDYFKSRNKIVRGNFPFDEQQRDPKND